jgi:acetyl-CoA acetyltransferase
MEDVFVVSAARTPIGKNNGYLRGYFAPELLAAALDEVLRRIDLDPALVEEVITGCVYQLGEQGFDLARMGILSSKLPIKTPGVTVNRQCGSSLTAIQMAHMMIATGNMDVVIASGCELMSKYTIMSDMNGTLYTGQPMNHPITRDYIEKYGIPDQIASAQKIANKFGITKDQCQQFAVASHQKAHKATVEGRFKKEIMPMKGLDKDGNEIIDARLTERPFEIMACRSWNKLSLYHPIRDSDHGSCCNCTHCEGCARNRISYHQDPRRGSP